MERVMTVEEKIRRAEEIYARRKQGSNRQVATVNVSSEKEKKDIKLLKKMIIQILVCVALYLIIYTIQNNKYVFSEDFTNKANEILSYDTNFSELYNNLKNSVINLFNKNNENGEESNNVNAIGGAEENNSSQEIDVSEPQVEEQELSQVEQDIQNIKNTTTFIKPVEGVISSKFGQRDTATGSVPKNHTGTDIAANLGTKIISATDG